MLKRRVWIGAIVVLTITGAAEAAELPSIKLPAAVDRVLRDYERAWQAHDASALADLFTEDGFVLGNGRPPVRGRDEIRAAYANAGGPLVLRALAYSTDGSVGYIIGAYGHGDGTDAGKFILALRRIHGRWQIAADMDNSNQRWPALTGPTGCVSERLRRRASGGGMRARRAQPSRRQRR